LACSFPFSFFSTAWIPFLTTLDHPAPGVFGARLTVGFSGPLVFLIQHFPLFFYASDLSGSDDVLLAGRIAGPRIKPTPSFDCGECEHGYQLLFPLDAGGSPSFRHPPVFSFVPGRSATSGWVTGTYPSRNFQVCKRDGFSKMQELELCSRRVRELALDLSFAPSEPPL